MLSKRTLIGIIVGSAIIGIGAYSLVSDTGLHTIKVNETFAVGEATSYQISANEHAHQHMVITGEKFDIKLSSPGDGLQIPKTSHAKEVTLDWVHLKDGKTIINLQNTGSSELKVDATLQVTTDPILFTYHIVVITSGMVIIGFSMGFTLRKPKGF
ncbi:hypothetical protein [Candidatus Nitrosarchaeum limnium]|uniref:Uncharacterized protein n=1 Tax=Candidatus Nitrosarchaeum limnium BG20 TaxID=859192 RepID=S2E5G6_9ARCH|nr:hypothetical protein [Candidatus Nitrosarchaeum limnium]EPA05968.1 hypothetical protein BG20_I2632 [Candidatus Nitrosarchaeum limnium BG20]